MKEKFQNKDDIDRKAFPLRRAMTIGTIALGALAGGAIVLGEQERAPAKPSNIKVAEKIATSRYDKCELGSVKDLQKNANSKSYEADGKPRGVVLAHLNVVENPEVARLMEEHKADTDPVHWDFPAITTRAIVPDSDHSSKYRALFAPMKHAPVRLHQDDVPSDIMLFPKLDNPVGTMTGIYVTTSSDTDTDKNGHASSADPASRMYRRRVKKDTFCGAIRLEEVGGERVWRKVDEPLGIVQPQPVIDYNKWQTLEAQPAE